MRGRLGERDRRVGVRTSASRGCRGTERGGCHRRPELIGRNRQVGLRACACSLNGASARGGGRLRGRARDVGACTAPIQARLAHKRTARTCSCTSPLARLRYDSAVHQTSTNLINIRMSLKTKDIYESSKINAKENHKPIIKNGMTINEMTLQPLQTNRNVKNPTKT